MNFTIISAPPSINATKKTATVIFTPGKMVCKTTNNLRMFICDKCGMMIPYSVAGELPLCPKHGTTVKNR